MKHDPHRKSEQPNWAAAKLERKKPLLESYEASEASEDSDISGIKIGPECSRPALDLSPHG